MGDLFWNKVAGVIIGCVLVVMVILELGHMLVPSHSKGELTAENTAYPFDWAAIESGSTGAAMEEVDTGPVDFGLLLASADIGAGERVIRRCVSCHSVEEGGANGTGPALWDVVGRAIGGVDGFGYSAALGEMGGEWTYEALYGFLESPANYAPGTTMSFRGLAQQEQRINLIAYLRSLSNNPAALPDPLPAIEEAAPMDEAMTDEAPAEEAPAADAPTEEPTE